MTDLGFGLADRRSVIVVLITLTCVSVLFGSPLPVDFSSVSSTFVGLVLLTGFIYLGRTASRIALALIFGLVSVPFVFLGRSQKQDKPETRKDVSQDALPETPQKKPNALDILYLIAKTLRALVSLPFILAYALIAMLILIVTMITKLAVLYLQDLLSEEGFEFEVLVYPANTQYRVRYLLAVLDHFALIAIAYAATLQAISNIYPTLSLLGLVTLLLVYAFTGQFTLVLKDALQKVEEHRKELIRAAGDHPNVIYTRPDSDRYS